jgi:DNA-directed RNA polymerase specialized sigma24 family protein
MTDGAHDSDGELAAIAAGDADAFARWLARCEAPLRRSLRSFAAAVDTEAVLQEALLRAWQVAPRVRADGRPDGLLRLAARIARNLAIDEARRRRAARTLEHALAGAREAEVAPAELPDERVRAAFARCRERLPAKPRAAIDARLDADGTRDDHALASALAMRTNTFLQNVTRARRLLAECLRRVGIDVGLELA